MVSRVRLTYIIVILAYELCITIGDEINLFWKRKPTLATLVFAFNRYTPLTYQLVSWLVYFVTSQAVRIHHAL